MKMMKTLHEHKQKQRRFTMRERAAEHEKKMGRVEEKRQAKQRVIKKQVYRTLGQLDRKRKHDADD